MTDLGLAVAQFAPVADATANLAGVTRLAERAVDQGAQLVVLPEYASFFLPRLGRRMVDAAEPLDGRFVSALADLARRLQVHLVVGVAEDVGDPDRFGNTVVALSPDGALAAHYRKVHLYDAFGQRESEWVRAGDPLPPLTFPVGGFNVGLQTCYDLRFPESSRVLVDAGANVVLVPSEWVAGPAKAEQWRTLLAARAIENTVFVAAADHPGPVGVGQSVILDPRGAELAVIRDGEGVATATLRRGLLDDVRTVNPALELRRYAVIPR